MKKFIDTETGQSWESISAILDSDGNPIDDHCIIRKSQTQTDKSSRRMFAIKFRGEICRNILEVSEGWCWAVLYSHKVLPSQVPPAFIEAKKQEGYEVIMINEVRDVYKDIADNMTSRMKDMPPEFVKLVNENFWDLLA